MPITLVNSKLAKKESNRIEIGSLVEYEHNGKPLLGLVTAERKNKWVVLNLRGGEIELISDRLYLLPDKIPATLKTIQEKTDFLENLSNSADSLAQQVNLDELWQSVEGELDEASVKDLADILYNTDNNLNRLTTRRALLIDTIYFKRKKIGYEPRASAVIEELKLKAENEAKKHAARETLISSILDYIKSPTQVKFTGLEPIVELAALGNQATQGKETLTLLEEIISRGNLNLTGRAEEKAFQILVAINHFSPDENLSLHRFSREARFSDEVMKNVASLTQLSKESSIQTYEDHSALYTVTIDGESTLDIDDAISLETLENGYRLFIHISDVANLIPEDSKLADCALSRGTSVYCPDFMIPMLPLEISEQSLSLVQDQLRSVMTFIITFDTSWALLDRKLCMSQIKVKKRLSYNEADALLYQEKRNDIAFEHETLLKLWDATCNLEQSRISRGASSFSRLEVSPVVRKDSPITLEDTSDDSPSRKLVGEMMILANETGALYAKNNKLPLIFRGQDPPDSPTTTLTDIPEGPAREFFRRSSIKRSIASTLPVQHAGLGLDAYAHMTSPIRRAVDLINQRQLVSFLNTKTFPYSEAKLQELLATIQPSLDEANIIQREGNRYWLLKYLQQEKIKELKGIVVKLEGPKPLVEIDILHTTHPFHPKDPNISKKLGTEVSLRIDNLDARRDIFTLREK